jgi:DNA-binding CsgD family transcriptional regulator/PAS domain-containing protein
MVSTTPPLGCALAPIRRFVVVFLKYPSHGHDDAVDLDDAYACFLMRAPIDELSLNRDHFNSKGFAIAERLLMIHSQLKELSFTVGKIYDAALTSDGWPAALDAICKFLKVQTAALMSYDIYDRKPPWQLQVGYDPQWMQVYTEKYLALNPYMDDVVRLGAGECNYSSRRPDYQNLLQSEFYHGWLKPQNFIDASVLVIEKSMNSITTLVNVRTESQGTFDDATMALLETLYPHLRRAALIGRVIEDHQKQAAEYAAAIDSLAAAMFVLTASGEVSQANSAGESLLSKGAPLRKVNGRLELIDGPANRSLRMALAAARDGEEYLGDKGVSIPVRGPGGTEYVVHMMPLNKARQNSIKADKGAAVVIFVIQTDAGDAAAIAVFTERFGLTAQETRVLQTVVEVGGVPAAADVLGISPATARTHVTSIFDKSGVRRQTDLIRLLTQMKSPFANLK